MTVEVLDRGARRRVARRLHLMGGAALMRGLSALVLAGMAAPAIARMTTAAAPVHISRARRLAAMR